MDKQGDNVCVTDHGGLIALYSSEADRGHQLALVVDLDGTLIKTV